MGFYYGPERPPEEEKPPGCLETLIITRAVFAVILPVLAALILVTADIAAIFILFTMHPALALIPVALTVVAIWLFSRWEQGRYGPPDA